MNEIDQQAFARSTETPLSEVVQYLCDVYDRRIVAIAAGAFTYEEIPKWATGESVPDGEIEQALRLLYRVTLLLMTVESKATMIAWALGMNDCLDDQAPVTRLSDNPEGVLDAARSFYANG